MPLTAIGGAAGTVTIGNESTGFFPEVLHPDVQAYVGAQASVGYIMTVNEIDAVNNLVWAMVGSGIWDKMQVVYPCIGNATTGANSFKWNLKNIASFNITFFGSWTFAQTGMQVATTSRSNYGRTGYTPSVNQTLNSAHASIYLRNFYLSSTLAAGVFGSYGQFEGQGTLIGVSQYVANSANMTCQNAGPQLSGTINLTGKAGGLLTVTRNSTQAQSFSALNDGFITGAIGTSSANRTIREMWIGTDNISGGANLPQPQEIAFASIGLGLSRVDIRNFYAIVQAFQTKLGRQV